MQVDPNKSAVQNLLALIDASNPGAPDQASEVVASAPVAGSFPNNADTKVTLTGAGLVSGTNYTGSVDVTYKRLSLAAEAATPSGPVPLRVGSSAAAALSVIESYFGFIPAEISAPDFTPLGTTGAQTVTLSASNSYVYEDGSTDISVNWTKSTALLLHMNGSNGATTVTDETGLSVTNTGCQISTVQSVFGGSSLVLPYSGSPTSEHLQIADDVSFHITGDMTIESFVRLTALDDTVLIEKSPNSTITNRFFVELRSGVVYLQLPGQSAAVKMSNSALATNTWYHLAFVHHNNVWTVYINGVATGLTISSAADWSTNTSPLTIGNNLTFSSSLPGYLDEFRISNVARYTANFTTPAAPFMLD
jgi:Concanavalin A-like lectin/glucanases superfamily